MSNIHACETSKLTDRACVYELHVYFIAYLLKLIRMGITFDRRPKNISRILFGRIDQSLRYRNISVRFFACCFFGNFSLKICLENSVSLKNLTGKSGRLASVSFGLSSIFSMAIGNGNVVPHSKAHQKSVFTFHLKNRNIFGIRKKNREIEIELELKRKQNWSKAERELESRSRWMNACVSWVCECVFKHIHRFGQRLLYIYFWMSWNWSINGEFVCEMDCHSNIVEAMHTHSIEISTTRLCWCRGCQRQNKHIYDRKHVSVFEYSSTGIHRATLILRRRHAYTLNHTDAHTRAPSMHVAYGCLTTQAYHDRICRPLVWQRRNMPHREFSSKRTNTCTYARRQRKPNMYVYDDSPSSSSSSSASTSCVFYGRSMLRFVFSFATQTSTSKPAHQRTNRKTKRRRRRNCRKNRRAHEPYEEATYTRTHKNRKREQHAIAIVWEKRGKQI